MDRRDSDLSTAGGKFIHQFSETQQAKMDSVGDFVEGRYRQLPTTGRTKSDVFMELVGAIKKSWYWFLILPVLAGGYFIAWYVCSGLLFFILLGMVLSYFFTKGSSLWLLDMNRKSEITPISVGVEIYKELPKAEEPLHMFSSRSGDRVLPVWNFRRDKPLQPAITMIRDPWAALYDIRRYDILATKLAKALIHEGKMVLDDTLLKLEAAREFAPRFMDEVGKKLLPALEQVPQERVLQKDVNDLEQVMSDEMNDIVGGRGL